MIKGACDLRALSSLNVNNFLDAKLGLDYTELVERDTLKTLLKGDGCVIYLGF